MSRLILEIIAISGEMPVNQAKRLHGGTRYKELLVVELKKRQLIDTYYKDRLRGLRLTSEGKRLLLKDTPDRLTFYLTGNTETSLLKSEITRRLRLHRMSEAYITMHNAGVAIFRDEKPDMFRRDNPHMRSVPYPCYYNSREIKEIGIESTKIRGSRATGIMLTVNNAYIIYNTGDSLLKWDYNAETRFRALMQTILCRERGLYKFDSIGAIMLGKDMKTAHDLLICASGMNSNYLSLDRENTSFYYFPNDSQGETLIKLICSQDIRTEIDSRLSEELHEKSLSMRFENDAVDDDGNYVMFAYDFDMPRIIRFNNALNLYGKSGTIICFDFQADVLRQFCPNNVQLRTIDFDSFKRRFFP